MNDNFHSYLFHFNVYENLWYVFTRDNSNNYFSDRSSIKTLSAPDIQTLLKALSKGVNID